MCPRGICASACSATMIWSAAVFAPGVAGAQLAGQRLAGLIAVGEHRVNAVAVLEVTGRALLLRMRADQRRVQIDRQPLKDTGQLPDTLTRAGVSVTQRVTQARRTGDPVDHPKRRRGRRDRTEQRRLIADHAQVGQAIAAIGEHHRQIANHAATVMAAGPQPRLAQRRRQRPRQTGLVGHSGQQRAARMRHQPRSVRRDFYGYLAPPCVTFKVILPSRSFRPRQPEQSLLRRTDQRPRTPGPLLLHAGSGLAS